MHTKTVYLMWS